MTSIFKIKFDKNSDFLNDDYDRLDEYEKEIEKGDKFIDHFMSNDTTKQSNTAIKKTLYNNKDVVTNTRDKIDKEKKIKKLNKVNNLQI